MPDIKNPDRDQSIRSSGIVQAVIASGAPIEEWETRARYGLQLQVYFARRLAGNTLAAPKLPQVGESTNG